MDFRFILVTGILLTPLDRKLALADFDDLWDSEEASPTKDILGYVPLCCELNKLQDFSSCLSTSSNTSNDLKTMRTLFNHKLKCNAEDIHSFRVNLSDFRLYKNEPGLVYLNEITYSPDSYCVHARHDYQEQLSLLMCSPGCTPSNPCHRKCCGFHEAIQLNDTHNSIPCKHVEPANSKFFPAWSSKASPTVYSNRFINYQLHDFSGSCGNQPDKVVYDFKISADGRVEYLHAYNTFIPLANYCVDELLDAKGMSERLVLLICNSDIISYMWTPMVLQLVYSLVSCSFLGVSVAIYFLIRREHSIHGWTQFSFLLSSIFFYVMKAVQAAVILHVLSKGEMTYYNQIALVDNFFVFGLLLNVINMNAHVFWTFLKLMPDIKLNNSKDLKCLINSIIVCWVSAAFLALVIITAYESTENEPERMVLTTKIYMWIVGILCLVTLTLALGSLAILCKRFRERSSIPSTRDSNSSQMISIMMRFLCVTGLIWTLELLEILVQKPLFARGLIWNSLQFLIYTHGVVQFFVFVWNKKILISLTKRFPGCDVLREMRGYFARDSTFKMSVSYSVGNRRSSTSTQESLQMTSVGIM